MTTGLLIGGCILALAVGVWVGLGAPGWPWQPEGRSSKLERRPINPIAWGRTGKRDRLKVRTPEDRQKLNLRDPDARRHGGR